MREKIAAALWSEDTGMPASSWNPDLPAATRYLAMADRVLLLLGSKSNGLEVKPEAPGVYWKPPLKCFTGSPGLCLISHKDGVDPALDLASALATAARGSQIPVATISWRSRASAGRDWLTIPGTSEPTRQVAELADKLRHSSIPRWLIILDDFTSAQRSGPGLKWATMFPFMADLRHAALVGNGVIVAPWDPPNFATKGKARTDVVAACDSYITYDYMETFSDTTAWLHRLIMNMLGKTLMTGRNQAVSVDCPDLPRLLLPSEYDQAGRCFYSIRGVVERSGEHLMAFADGSLVGWETFDEQVIHLYDNAVEEAAAEYEKRIVEAKAHLESQREEERRERLAAMPPVVELPPLPEKYYGWPLWELFDARSQARRRVERLYTLATERVRHAQSLPSLSELLAPDDGTYRPVRVRCQSQYVKPIVERFVTLCSEMEGEPPDLLARVVLEACRDQADVAGSADSPEARLLAAIFKLEAMSLPWVFRDNDIEAFRTVLSDERGVVKQYCDSLIMSRQNRDLWRYDPVPPPLVLRELERFVPLWL